jgi:hypothetical protein
VVLHGTEYNLIQVTDYPRIDELSPFALTSTICAAAAMKRFGPFICQLVPFIQASRVSCGKSALLMGFGIF